jgi:hypothetical protein
MGNSESFRDLTALVLSLKPLLPESLILAPQSFQFALVLFTVARLFLLSFLLPHQVVAD